jgi:serine/threonine protein kinase
VRSGDISEEFNKLILEKGVQQVTFQLLKGLTFIHRNKVAHRDLKPAVSACYSVLLGKKLSINLDRTYSYNPNHLSNSRSRSATSDSASTYKRFKYRLLTRGRRCIYSSRATRLYPPGHESTSRYSGAADMWILGEITHMLLTKYHTFANPYDLFSVLNKRRTFPIENY